MRNKSRFFLSRTIINVHTSTVFVFIHHYFEPEICKKGSRFTRIHCVTGGECKNHQQNIHSSLNTMNFEIIKWALHSALCYMSWVYKWLEGALPFRPPTVPVFRWWKATNEEWTLLEVLFLMNKLRKANFHFHLSQWTLPTKFHPPLMQIDYSVTFVRSRYKVSWL